MSDEEYDSYELQYSHDTDTPEKVAIGEKNEETEEIKGVDHASILDETIEPDKEPGNSDAEDIKINAIPCNPDIE